MARAVELDQPALAITDWMSLAGAVQFQLAARAAGIHAVIGAEVLLEQHPVVLLCQSNAGYAALCRLLSKAFSHEHPHLEFVDLEADHGDLLMLAGGPDSFIRSCLEQHQPQTALEWLGRCSALMVDRVVVELSSHRLPGDSRMLSKLSNLARTARLPVAATNAARYAVREDWILHDLLTCARLGISVAEAHPERPDNSEAYLKTESELRSLIRSPQAFTTPLNLAQSCQMDLLPGAITPPGANLPLGVRPDEALEAMCRAALPKRYPSARFTLEYRRRARAQLTHELEVIGALELSEFFLVVAEVVQAARDLEVRLAGRGSAANSIVAYLCGVTGVDPLEHNLLFERFLHTGRAGTPDIDVDFQSSRRLEVIHWLEQRFAGQTAMTANVMTYRLRSAVRDAAKVLGFPLEVINRANKRLPHGSSAKHVRQHREALEDIFGSSPLFESLLGLVERMADVPRTLGQHSGGMLLTRDALTNHTPIQTSANGVKQAVFAKDDVEAMGLVKFDVLGLRSLDVVQGSVEKHLAATGERLEIDDIALDDPRVFALICSGETLALFQIESPGQMHLIAKHQPRTFHALIAQIALLRPGPIEGGMVNTFVNRACGLEAVRFAHPSLEPILSDTYGVILYQEQVLQVTHLFAGMSYGESDDYRRLMSKWRDGDQMLAMRERFVSKALETHPDCSLEVAEEVFRQVSHFAGYGFPRSHAASFAKTVYQTAFLKLYHPAAFLASVMEYHPGMYPRQSFVLEAQRCGVTVLQPILERSSLGFTLERHDQQLAIRLPLEGIKGIGVEQARAIVLERSARPFSSLEDLYRRVRVPKAVLASLAQAGALEGFGLRREALWSLGVLETQFGPPGGETPLLPTPAATDLPDLELLTSLELGNWDARTYSASLEHPISRVRPRLELGGVTTIREANRANVTIAGLVIARQRPPAAKGLVFLYLEDETGRMQCVASPQVWEQLQSALRAPAIILAGQIQRRGQWRGLMIRDARALEVGLKGGRSGLPRA